MLAAHGTDSTETGIMMTEEIAGTAPHVALLELLDDHSCFVQNPDRYLEALEAHVAGAVR